MRRPIVFGLVVISLFAALAPVSPYSVLKTKESLDLARQAHQSYLEGKALHNQTKQELQSAKAAFDTSRVFEVYYGDIVRINQLFEGISTISVASVTSCNAAEYFAPIASWSEDDGTKSSAIKFSLVSDDLVAALNIINKLELPIYKLEVAEPNLLDVTFLTGEAIL